MARIDNAYAYYISTYAKKTVSRYDSHKKSELRKVYNKIVKINKDSPLYKIPNLTDAKKYAIDIKENARSIQNVVASLSDQYGSFEDSFKKKVAMSSDDEKVSVTYIGDGSEESKTNNFDIEVQRLATPQVNQGRFLKDNTLSMRPGAYSFELHMNFNIISIPMKPIWMCWTSWPGLSTPPVSELPPKYCPMETVRAR